MVRLEEGVVSRPVIAAAAASVGGAMLLLWVNAFGVNVPIADDWDHVKTSVTWHDDGIRAATLFRPHNEHCLAIPRLANHALLEATGGNYRALLFFNASLAIASLAILLVFASRWPLPPAVFATFAAAVSLLWTGWSQWQNWIWAFQTPWFLLPLVIVAAAVVVARTASAGAAVAATAVAAWLGPFCMANGLFVGWAVLPGLVLALAEMPRDRRWRWLAAAIVAVVAATAVGGLILARSRGPDARGLSAVLASPLEAVRLCLAVLGSPLDPRGAFHGQKLASTVAGGLSLGAGLAAVASAARLGRAMPSKDYGPGFALMLYGLVSVAAVVVGRLSMLATDPVESRYHTFAVAWHVGVLLTLARLAVDREGGQGRARRIALVAASIACIAPTLIGMKLFYRHGVNMRAALEGHQAIYRAARDPGGREKLQEIARHYGADGILDRLDGMRRAGILHADYAPTTPGPEDADTTTGTR